MLTRELIQKSTPRPFDSNLTFLRCSNSRERFGMGQRVYRKLSPLLLET